MNPRAAQAFEARRKMLFVQLNVSACEIRTILDNL